MRRAFTLIELLVVLAIIAILIALLIPAIGLVQFAARAADTANRMENVQIALSTSGEAEITAAYRLHRDLIAPRLLVLGRTSGVIDFVKTNRLSLQVPNPTVTVTGTATVQAWLYLDTDAAIPSYLFKWPWGKPALAWTSGTVGMQATAPEAKTIAGLEPGISWQLLRAAGVFPSPTTAEADYSNDRRRSAKWNDAWGNPLAVAWGLHQAAKNTTVPAEKVVTWSGAREFYPEDTWLVECTKRYQTSRAVYLAVAAAGPRRRDAPTGVAADDAAAVWRQVTQIDVTPGDGAGKGVFHLAGKRWDETAFDRPPWQGVARAKATVDGRAETCLLTQPMVIE